MMEGFITSKEALSLGRKQVNENYKRHVNPGLASLMSVLNFDKHFVKASGINVWDSEGNKYLDFLGGYGSLNTGHNHPKIIAAIMEAKERPNLLQASIGAMSGALAKNLSLLTPGNLSISFFCNSGAEAVEGALKLARIVSGRQTIVACQGSFHGKTLGALSITGRDKYKKPYEPLIKPVEMVPFADLKALEKVLSTGDVAAFILEPVQGEGGINIPPQGYLKDVQELCQRYGTLLVVDEIQTGLGRTGKMFACEHEGVVPDVLCLAKSLGGGIMPLGAFVTKESLWNKAYGGFDKCLLHTSTFGGNTWASTAGIAALEVIIEENLVQNAQNQGEYLLSALKEMQDKYPLIKDVRGQGLLIGIEFEQKTSAFMEKVSKGMLGKLSEEYTGAMIAGMLHNDYRIITAYTLNNPNVIRLEPPLSVTREEIDYVLQSLEAIFKKKHGFWGLAMSSGKTAITSFLKKD